MRLPILRTLCALGVAALVAAGAPLAQTHAASVTASPLSVELYCPAAGLLCEAYAAGGSGVYSFEWTNARDPYQDGAYSGAYRICPAGQYGVVVEVTVSDGAAIATAGVAAVCRRT